MEIFEGNDAIGTLTAEREGLFWKISCQIEKKREQLRRIFVLSKYEVQYLGIPDRQGKLTAHIAAKHLPDGIDGAVATAKPRGDWMPWRGKLDGVTVEQCWLRQTDGAPVAALPESEAYKFPAWAGEMHTETVYGEPLAVVSLSVLERLPQTEIINGGTEDETMDRDDSDDMLSGDTSADDSVCEEGRQADCTDL